MNLEDKIENGHKVSPVLPTHVKNYRHSCWLSAIINKKYKDGRRN